MNKIKAYVKNIVFSFQILFKASIKLLIAKTVISILSISTTFFELMLIRNIINSISNDIQRSTRKQLIVIYIILLCITVIILNFSGKISTHINYYYEDQINLYLDNVLVNKISRIKYPLFDESKILNKIADSWELINTVKALPELMFTFITGLGKIFVSLLVLANLSTWASVIIIILVLISVLLYKKVNEARWTTERESIGHIRKMNYYKDCLGLGYTSYLKLFNYSSFFINKYTDVWKIWNMQRKKLSKYTIVISLSSVILLSIAELSVLYLSLYSFIINVLLIGDVIYYFSIVQELKAASEEFVYSGSSLLYALDELTCVRELINMDSVDELGSLSVSESYEITFKNVWFKYPEQKNYVLQNCNFTLGSNEVIGLVGRNGAGKSTIVKLILALYEPTKGSILLNGINYNKYNVSELRKKIGVMFQDYNRYSLSLKENIILSELESHENNQMLKEAIESSGCADLMPKFKNDICSQLTKRFDESGIELSVGQWQKVALARSFFGNKVIYLLDEPSSSLDPIAEDKIVMAFKELVNDHSGLIVTHRLSSLSLVDKILVLDDGKIIESGTHRELLLMNGIYAEFHMIQASNYF